MIPVFHRFGRSDGDLLPLLIIDGRALVLFYGNP